MLDDMAIDNFNIQDRKYQNFADGQSAFHKHVVKVQYTLWVVKPEAA